ncbi:hypothetical protein GCM10023335_73290 [Streptomyces siamensis]|uniref:Transposase n=1 Tax=Streptomyces siamensis TaxID=1274986 RepID=A0ABP9JJ93_9ACTN
MRAERSPPTIRRLPADEGHKAIGNAPTRDDPVASFDPAERITGKTITGVRGCVPQGPSCSGHVVAEQNELLRLRTWAQLRAKNAMWSRAMSSATAIGSEL